MTLSDGWALSAWTDLTFIKYLTRIAILSVMSSVRHWDIKAYWNAGNSNVRLSLDCSKYMSQKSLRIL